MYPPRLIILCALALLCVQPYTAQSIESRTDSLTLEQKVAQMFVISFYGPSLNYPVQELLDLWQPGAVVLLPSNLESPEQITGLTNSIQQKLNDNGGIPAFIAVDQEGGIISRLGDGFTQWPVPTLLTATQDTNLAYSFGEALAQELRAVGLNMNLAPVSDLLTNRDNPIIGRRAFGSNPNQVAPIIGSVVAGMQSGGVLATVKHFPGHGATDTDSHLTLPVLSLQEATLFERELIPYQAAIAEDVGAVMMAHIVFPGIQADDALPASLSSDVIGGLLREKLGYEGIIITDALDMDAIDTVFSPEEAAIQAINAGNDLILIGAHISPERQASAMQAVVDAIADGIINEEQIDDSVQRIIAAKERMDILNWEPLDPVQASSRIGVDDHNLLIDAMFERGITIVDGETMLPLSDRTLFIYPGNRYGLWQACQREGWQPFAVSTYPTTDEIETARQSASQVGQIVVFTQNVEDNPQQKRLVEALPPEKTMVVALWSPFDRLFLPETAGYMVTYSPLMHANRAICAILQGEAIARGILSVNLDL